MKKFLKDWDRFWFEPQTAYVLGAFRIIIGLMTIYTFGLLAKDIALFFSDEGVLTVGVLSRVVDREFHSLLVWITPPWGVALLLVALFVAAIFFTIGLWTRWSAVALFILVVSFHERNNIVLNSGDTLIRNLLFFFMFAPAGAAWSVDRLRQTLSQPEHRELPPALIAPWTQRMMQIQLAVVYITTAYAKSRGDLWHGGQALYYVFGLVDYHVTGVEQLMNYPVLYSALTFATLFCEIAVPFLLWFKSFRWYAFLMGLALHGWIMLGMTLPVFGSLMLCAYLPFVSEEEMAHFLARWRAKGKSLKIYFDGECPLCQRSRRVIQALDVFAKSDWVDLHGIAKDQWPKGKTPKQLMTSMHVVTPSGTVLEGFHGFRRLAWALPVFWSLVPFLYIPGIPWLGVRIYRWVANNRYIFVQCDDSQVCKVHQH